MTRWPPLWLQESRYPAQADRMLLGALWPKGASWGGDVTVSSGRTVNIAACRLAIPAPDGLGSILCVNDDREQVTVPVAPAAGQNRVDVIVARIRASDVNGLHDNDFVFDFVSGDTGTAFVMPELPVGTLALAAVYSRGGSASIDAGDIVDLRPSGLGVHSRSGRNYATAGTQVQPNTLTRMVNMASQWQTGNFRWENHGLRIPVRGIYVVAAQTRYEPPAPFTAATYLALDDVMVMDWANSLSTGVIPGVGGTDVIRAQAGQLLTMWTLHRYSAVLWTASGQNFSYFSASLIAEE